MQAQPPNACNILYEFRAILIDTLQYKKKTHCLIRLAMLTENTLKSILMKRHKLYHLIHLSKHPNKLLKDNLVSFFIVCSLMVSTSYSSSFKMSAHVSPDIITIRFGFYYVRIWNQAFWLHKYKRIIGGKIETITLPACREQMGTNIRQVNWDVNFCLLRIFIFINLHFPLCW